jgi:hypothetical protein
MFKNIFENEEMKAYYIAVVIALTGSVSDC